jgi:hypothetical protein
VRQYDHSSVAQEVAEAMHCRRVSRIVPREGMFEELEIKQLATRLFERAQRVGGCERKARYGGCACLIAAGVFRRFPNDRLR